MPPIVHPFPRLPAELRATIYYHVLSAKAITHKPSTAETHHTGEYALGLAFASRQISEEFLHYAYEYANFNFLIKSLCTTSWASWAVSGSVLSRVRHVQFIRDCHDDDETRGSALNSDRELYLPKLVKECSRLRTIEVEVILKTTPLDDAKIKKMTPWCDTLAGEIPGSNVWLVPACDWTGSWIL